MIVVSLVDDRDVVLDTEGVPSRRGPSLPWVDSTRNLGDQLKLVTDRFAKRRRDDHLGRLRDMRELIELAEQQIDRDLRFARGVHERSERAVPSYQALADALHMTKQGVQRRLHRAQFAVGQFGDLKKPPRTQQEADRARRRADQDRARRAAGKKGASGIS